MQLTLKKNKIPGCYELYPDVRSDVRGSFIKTFHRTVFEEHHLETKFAEEYYSVSHKNVLRGMHFQTPPFDHTKIVYCVHGEVMDAVVDIRLGSPTYGQFEVFTLNAKDGNMLYIPSGMAHGFYVISNQAILMYKVTTIYHADQDTGILWDSIGIPWCDDCPVVSERDNNFQRLEDFKSPFHYKVSNHEY